MEPINVLSLFDGISCGQIALERAGIKVNNYFASEIDKHAIEVTKSNYPNTIHLGDVRDLDISSLPKIDLLIGGSPCQSFSFAGRAHGMTTEQNIDILTLEHYLQLKKEKFEFDGQSYLFWEFVRLYKELQPEHFLLENVLMHDKWKDLISETLSVLPIMINSNRVSAQNRKRLYWTSIPWIKQPKDKKIFVKDILEPHELVADKYFVKQSTYDWFVSSSRNHEQDGNGFRFVLKDPEHKGFTLTTKAGSRKSDNFIHVPGREIEGRVDVRMLTPIECERMQTVPDNYTKVATDTQRFKMLGNGWTVDVIAHMFKRLKEIL